MIDNLVHQYAWYIKDEYGSKSVEQVNNICCLGYEDIYGHKYDMMDGVDLPNTTGNAGKWRIWLPDGSTFMIKGHTTNGAWTTAVAHGFYMALVPVGTSAGSSSTHYCDIYWINTSIGRVVYRGYNNANANGGVSFANATNDASNTNTNVGSRLDNYKSAYINGDVSPSTCRECQASAKAHDAESRNTKCSGRVW